MYAEIVPLLTPVLTGITLSDKCWAKEAAFRPSSTLTLPSAGFRIRIHMIRIWISIQDFRLNSDPDPNPGFWWPKIEKIYSWKKREKFGSKTTIYLSLGLHKGRPSYRRSLQLSNETSSASNMNFFLFFSTLLGNFCPPGSEFRSGFQIQICIGSGSRSETLPRC